MAEHGIGAGRSGGMAEHGIGAGHSGGMAEHGRERVTLR
jgi:hypothetical protein